MVKSTNISPWTYLLWTFQLYLQWTLADIPTYYMDQYCSNTLDMGQAQIQAGRLKLYRPGQGLRYTSCMMYIRAPANKMLTLQFHFFDIQSPRGCNDDSLQLFEDRFRQLPLSGKLCNTNRVPDKAYVTSGEEVAVELRKENLLGDQIELVFTAFTYAPCTGGEYTCDNGHCISNDLYCNDLDNCGDGSDHCLLKRGAVIAIIAASVIFIVIVAIIIAILLYRRQRKIRREREKRFFYDLGVTNTSFLHDSDWEKRSFSDMSSIYSSTLRKQPSLLGRRDQQMRMVGYSNQLGGSRASTLQRNPVLHPYVNEMASKVHYIVTDGRSRSSTLDKKPPSLKDDKKGSSLERKKSKSAELRTPFYFDKDGYYTDTSLNRTHQDVYAIPDKKKKTKKKTQKQKEKEKEKEKTKTHLTEDAPDGGVKSGGKSKKEKKMISTAPVHLVPVGDNQRFGYWPSSSTPVETSDPVKPSHDQPDSRPPAIYVTPPDLEPPAPTTVTYETPYVETVVNETGPRAGTGFSDLPAVSTVSTSLYADVSGGGYPSKTDQSKPGEDKMAPSRRSTHREQRSHSTERVHSSPKHWDSPDAGRHEVHTGSLPDIYDHVVSFRSYDAPVPKEDHYIVRKSSNRSLREE